ncbi:histidine phosphatase family protein [Rhodococcus jostii]|uniref:histidine phosphatase family protein n=1 Tax=Rhodococcus jostii TaxID=132919 RepID=UPI0036454590
MGPKAALPLLALLSVIGAEAMTHSPPAELNAEKITSSELPDTGQPARAGMLKRVALVRHGETAWNQLGLLQGRVDLPLNETGRAQAARAAVSLSASSWDEIVCSPLERAQQTAQSIQASVGHVSMSLDARLTEKSFGVAEGMGRHAAFEQWPDGCFDGGESEEAVSGRVQSLVADLMQMNTTSVIVVCHVVIIRHLAMQIARVDPGFVENGSVLTLVRKDDAQTWKPHFEGR